jgi:hypothetical protein
MKRGTFDRVASIAGLTLALMLLVAGGLLAWASSSVVNEVHSQLAAQKIVFLAANSRAAAAPQFRGIRQYAVSN